MKATVVRKEKFNTWAIGDATFYLFHRDDFENGEYEKLKVGDTEVKADYWYKMNCKQLKEALKPVKTKKRKNYSKAKIFLDKPKKIKHKTFNFGGLPDGTIVNGYIIASKGGQHLIYCAKDCFSPPFDKYDAFIDSGCGSVSICVKKGKYYHVKHKNSNIFRGWRNVGEDCISEFYNRFIDGILEKPEKEEESTFTEKHLLSVFKKIDTIELAEAKKQLAEYKKQHP